MFKPIIGEEQVKLMDDVELDFPLPLHSYAVAKGKYTATLTDIESVNEPVSVLTYDLSVRDAVVSFTGLRFLSIFSSRFRELYLREFLDATIQWSNNTPNRLLIITSQFMLMLDALIDRKFRFDITNDNLIVATKSIMGRSLTVH